MSAETTTYRLHARVSLWAWAGLAAMLLVAVVAAIVGAVTGAAGGWVVAGGLAVAALGCAAAVAMLRRRAGVSVRLAADALTVADARGWARVPWGAVQRVREIDAAAVFDVRTDDGATTLRLRRAGSSRWDEFTRDVASRLDADRGYSHRLCERPTSGGCSNALGCAGSGSCALAAGTEPGTDGGDGGI